MVDVASADDQTARLALAKRASSERLAARTLGGEAGAWIREPLDDGGELIRAASSIRRSDGRRRAWWWRRST